MYDVYSKFDIEKHKEHFINYCEVAISPEGMVSYAVPSHQSFLEIQGALNRGISVSEYTVLCPISMYADYLTWLMQDTGYVLCWSDFWMGCPNSKQKSALLKLIENNLVKNVRKCS